MRFVNRKGVYVLEQLGATVKPGARETSSMYRRQFSNLNNQPHFKLSSNKQNGYAGLEMTSKMATVRKNKEGFTPRQVKAVMEARRHFKAAIQSPSIAYCDALFRNILLTTGFVPLQWQNLMNFAIEKKPGDFRLSKMRTIQLMNSEAQANNKKAGRAAMQFAKAHSLIPDGQCGSRKSHQAIDLALSKRLVWDLLIFQRREAGWISNDAKSCFDHVVHWVAIVTMLRFGLTWRVLSSMFNMLSSATHHVCTGFGDSKRSFCPPSAVPLQGCGQGNGAGPPI
ncbi:unnamed protein product [Cylindrotheca closterium]|uniref:Uncharacterized protein n=1 Tax=Cylindrotheca closterium TaxID=2856 RepID=A0AAD2JJI1_9STRA|nr:unnamed protein product [Cylindrotheca closterium]